MKVVRAEKMGFCFGVKEAVNMVNKVIEENKGKNIFMLGMLVHNNKVIEDLEKKGIKTICEDEIDKCKENDVVIIRAHGITYEILKKLEEKKLKIYDATCVFVSKIKRIMLERIKEGNISVIVGDKNHPEIRGIISYAENVFVGQTYDEIFNLLKDKKNEKICVMAQTTLNKDLYEDIKNKLKENYKDIIFENTICGATQERQNAVKKLAESVNIVLVIGGKHSSNTKKLYDISKAINKNTYFIEGKEDIKREWFNLDDLVGITAGTSTPEKSIKEIEEYLLNL